MFKTIIYLKGKIMPNMLPNKSMNSNTDNNNLNSHQNTEENKLINPPALKLERETNKVLINPSKQNKKTQIIRRTRFSNKEKFISYEEKERKENENNSLIQAFLAKKSITKCEPRWAAGSVNMSLFGTEV
jgi:hypothetical protein